MKTRFIVPVAMLLASTAACDRQLNTEPVDRVPAENLIVDAPTARAALIGAYDGLQALSYYGRNLQLLGDVPSDNTAWIGTFQYVSDLDKGTVKADNTTVNGVWNAIYSEISRVNLVLARVPALTDLGDAEKNQILGEALFLRALSFHNLVRLWGPIPMPLTPLQDPTVAGALTRSSVADVYTQILADLDQAATKIGTVKQTTRASLLAVEALRARVLLYKGDYAGALVQANLVLAGRDTLTVPFPALFAPAGDSTSEDIFRVSFTAVEYNELGYYYLRTGGRHEVMPTLNLYQAFDTLYLAQGATKVDSTVVVDVRRNWSILRRSATTFAGTKFPTAIGAEHLHAIRLAEVVLIKAEALARTNQLTQAVAEYNKVRTRAGLPKHVFGVTVLGYVGGVPNILDSQADVIAAIDHERRLELAFEGDRFPDLNRTGLAGTVLGLTGSKAFQLLLPIPAASIATSPGLTQNPGY